MSLGKAPLRRSEKPKIRKAPAAGAANAARAAGVAGTSGTTHAAGATRAADVSRTVGATRAVGAARTAGAARTTDATGATRAVGATREANPPDSARTAGGTRTADAPNAARTGDAARGVGANRALNAAKRYATVRDELTPLVLKALLIARDAVYNAKDLLVNSSRIAFLATRDCEKELDHIERQIDERMPAAITRVGETKARQLLACLKFITDLERIGDLVYSVALHLQPRPAHLAQADSVQLVAMADILCGMLDDMYRGFLERDLECARRVLRTDTEVDQICHGLFQRHLQSANAKRHMQGFDVLLMAQALERVGDHTKNLAEELFSLIEGRSLRHVPKRLMSS